MVILQVFADLRLCRQPYRSVQSFPSTLTSPPTPLHESKLTVSGTLLIQDGLSSPLFGAIPQVRFPTDMNPVLCHDDIS
jgi:hypothetical protein